MPRLCLNSFSPIRHGTTDPEKCRAVLDLSRKIFSAIPTPRAREILCSVSNLNNDAANTSTLRKPMPVPAKKNYRFFAPPPPHTRQYPRNNLAHQKLEGARMEWGFQADRSRSLQ